MLQRSGDTSIYLFIVKHNKILDLFYLCWVLPPTVESLMTISILGKDITKIARPLWKKAVFTSSLCIWLERNRRIFEDHNSLLLELWERLEFLASLWAEAHGNFSDLPITDHHRNRQDIFCFPIWFLGSCFTVNDAFLSIILYGGWFIPCKYSFSSLFQKKKVFIFLFILIILF